MGFRDLLTDSIGGLLGSGIEILTESFAKASNSDDPSQRKGREQALGSQAKVAVDLPPDAVAEEPRSLLVDPFAIVDQLGYRDKPSGITYQTLRQMSQKVVTYAAIRQIRLTQIASFAQRQTDRREPGFGIVLRDTQKSPTKAQLRRCWELEEWILNTGTPAAHAARVRQQKFQPWMEVASRRDNFKTFIRKLARDSLELDQACFEVQYNRKYQPCAFYAVDGATIRLADTPIGVGADDPQQVKYIQVYDEMIVSEFAGHELCAGIRNPRSDIRSNGYGNSELEMLIDVVTSTLWSFEYNQRNFKNGSLINGVMNFKGSVPDSKVDSFRRQWKIMVSGVRNSHKTPMTNVDELQWIDLKQDNSKMGFSEWMDWLFKITAAVCQIDTAEAGFNYGNSGQTSQMFATPVDAKLKNSKDRGLGPLLKDIADWLNVYLIWQLDEDLELRFLGLDAKSSDQAIDQGKKRAEYLMTVDELRAEEDLEPLPDGQGEIILNQVFLQAKQGAEAAAQGGGFGDGEDGGDDGDFGDGQDSDQTDGQDFDKLFPEEPQASKSFRNDLRKGRARVKVYEIDL